MKLKDMSKEELEMLSYAELASMVLTENKKKMKIADIFKKICNLLGLTDAQFENGISEFFEIVSTNKLFVMLPEGFCDLKTRHNTKVIIEEEDEEIIVDEEEEQVEDKEEDEDIFYDENDDDDVAEDDLQDLVIVDEEEVNS